MNENHKFDVTRLHERLNSLQMALTTTLTVSHDTQLEIQFLANALYTFKLAIL